jgi:hypothetical protein
MKHFCCPPLAFDIIHGDDAVTAPEEEIVYVGIGTTGRKVLASNPMVLANNSSSSNSLYTFKWK